MSKLLRIILISLMVLSLAGLIAFYIQSGSGLYALSNLAEAMATTGTLDILLIWAYVLTFAAILLILILSIINMAGNKKSLKRTGLTCVLAVVLVVVSYFLASGDPVAVNLEVEPTFAQLKMTDTLLIMCYILMGVTFITLIWGSVRKLFNRQ